MTCDIFISYGRGDREFVAAIARRIESLGATVWYDARIAAATDDAAAKTADALQSAAIVAVMLSEDAARSRQLQTEVEQASAQGKAIAPILLDARLPHGALLRLLAGYPCITLTPDPRARADDIAAHLARLAGKDTGAPTSAQPIEPKSLAEREQTVDSALGGMIRNAVGADLPAPGIIDAYRVPRDAEGMPVRPGSGRAFAALNILTLGIHGVLAQRRALRDLRSNIRKL